MRTYRVRNHPLVTWYVGHLPWEFSHWMWQQIEGLMKNYVEDITLNHKIGKKTATFSKIPNTDDQIF